MTPTGVVISVLRGGCQIVVDDRTLELRLVGRHAAQKTALAVGDEVTFDPERGIVLERLPRRTQLARRRRNREHVLVANVDQLAIVASVKDPPFRPGAVDRFLLAAHAGGLGALLVVNKLDLLGGRPLPDEVRVYEQVLPVIPISARTGYGLDVLRERLGGQRTVFGGHSGVGKSSLLNALEPELRLETAPITGAKRGRHTTVSARWLRLPGGAVVVDTPGLREIASGPVDPQLVREAYGDVRVFEDDCRFRDCRHEHEPDCAVREAAERGDLSVARLDSYRRLRAEVESQRRTW